MDAGGRLAGRVERDAVIGTGDECDVRLRDPTVSRRHALLSRRADGLVLADLGSHNGTFLGGARVRTARVEPGARIDVGQTALWVVRAGAENGAFEGIVGRDPAMRLVFERIARVAPGAAPVVVVGETGTGKELVARALHRVGRPGGPFVALNCGAVPRELCESELFGHERGAFTGALAPRRGVFEEADGGTLLLDEIGELPLALQPKLLRALEAGVVRRVGAGSDRTVCVRVVAATHRDLGAEVRAARFREDLYHRLAAVVVRLPPLRDRPGDVPLLVERFLGEERAEGRDMQLGPGAIAWLCQQTWPGNVRELRNAVRRAVLLGGPVLRARDFRAEGSPPPPPDDRPTHVAIAGRSESEILGDVYRKTILLCGGSARLAARSLGLARQTMADRLRRFGESLGEPAAPETAATAACEAATAARETAARAHGPHDTLDLDESAV